MKKSNYITRAGFDKLEKERDQLLKVERPKTTKIVQWAASNGDRSENADYQYGKKKLREIDRRLRFLNVRINNAVVVESGSIQSNKIQFSATVTLQDEEEKTKVYTIVGEDEIDTKKGFISWRSPMARSLLGKEVGDIVTVTTPTDEREYEIKEVQYKL